MKVIVGFTVLFCLSLHFTPQASGQSLWSNLFGKSKDNETQTREAKNVESSADISVPGHAPKPPVELASFCQDPGLPFRSKISPVQSYYIDGEQITYKCDEFISLQQFRVCRKGKWIGESPICGKSLNDNDLIYMRVYDRSNYRMLADYNVSGRLRPHSKFDSSFISERLPDQQLRATNATNYLIELFVEKPSMFQMVRISFGLVNHLSDPSLSNNIFDIKSVTVSPFRACTRAWNNSISPWEYNSTRFDFWYFCRSENKEDFAKELKRMSSVVRIETSSQVPVTLDLATFMLAEPYRNNDNLSDPICGLPEIPIGLDSRVIHDQSNYVYNCLPHFNRIDSYGGSYQMRTCGLDYRWHGELPKCFPARTCPKFDSKDDETLTVVYKYDRIYYHNDTDWVAIKGTRAFFRCKDYRNIFVGQDMRICGEDGYWSDKPSNCLATLKETENLKSTPMLILVVAIPAVLVFAFILSACTIYSFYRLRSKNNNGNNMEMTGMPTMPESYYSPAKDVDEIYEQVEPMMTDARYAAYRPNQDGDYQALYPNDNHDNAYNHMAAIRSPPGDYYDDTSIIDPSNTRHIGYANSYEVMRRY